MRFRIGPDYLWTPERGMREVGLGKVGRVHTDPAQAEASGMTNERVERLEEQMVKVENVLVLFNERVGAMESAMRHALRRVDAAVNPTEPVAWGMGPSPGMGGSADRRGSGVGMGMPMLPRERYGDADGSGETRRSKRRRTGSGKHTDTRTRSTRTPKGSGWFSPCIFLSISFQIESSNSTYALGAACGSRS